MINQDHYTSYGLNTSGFHNNILFNKWEEQHNQHNAILVFERPVWHDIFQLEYLRINTDTTTKHTPRKHFFHRVCCSWSMSIHLGYISIRLTTGHNQVSCKFINGYSDAGCRRTWTLIYAITETALGQVRQI